MNVNLNLTFFFFLERCLNLEAKYTKEILLPPPPPSPPPAPNPRSVLEVTVTLTVGFWGLGVQNLQGVGEVIYLGWVTREKESQETVLPSPLLHQPLAFISPCTPTPCQSPSYQVWTRQECCKGKLIKWQHNALKILSVI